ncbi:adenosylcobinamide-GDP ribazoletransferase [Pseudoxanthobacter sp. M-2]|uniref:adenosylcobinamide-GDP ribazoletransferase n=1 Tax=Pseudoxanthobacter sp. M-2 TaxID=3078754 RepID=UPI0038FC5215
MASTSDDRLARAAAAIAGCLRFLARVPVPVLGPLDDPARLPDLARDAWAMPVAGAVIGLAGAAALWLTAWLGLPPLPAAAVAVAVGVAVTGALHEDGLADTADGLAAGGSAERRLAVMRDSHIGAAGAAALVLSLILRVSALAAIAEVSPTVAAAAFVAANAVSRASALAPLALLPPARTDGIAVAAGRPTAGGLTSAGATAAVLALLIGGAETGMAATIAGLAAAAVAVWLLLRLMRATLGGGTGDVAGAAEQAAACAFLLAVAATLP